MGAVVRWTVTIDRTTPVSPDANSIPRRNFIDDDIFTRMAQANIHPAPLSSDAEFLRRVTLDLTGRIPTPAALSNFLSDTNSDKRDNLVDTLIATSEFSDKWTMFFGDLLQNNIVNTQVERGVQGRDAFYKYIRDSIRQNKPYDQMAREMITATGDGYSVGPADWTIGTSIFAGPPQDTYDGGAVKLASMFLGIGAVDCLLCHDGARHLDQLNLWGSQQVRRDFWGLAAFFSRTTMTRAPGSGLVVDDLPSGDYELNTDWGNRVPRNPIGSVEAVQPSYPFSTSANRGIAQGENYREALARQVTGDLQFSRATVNYVWEKIMVEALVSPSNGFDPARLDPNNPPAAPWTLQPTNAALLDHLAIDFQKNGYNLRQLIGNIVKSNTYQLSSTYVGTWEAAYVPYYARKYVRRLDVEEILDAVTTATGLPHGYAIASPSTLGTVFWAMQLPDTSEPHNDLGMLEFMNAFGRGDRDQNPRRIDGSIAQALSELNYLSITSRTHRSISSSRVAQLLKGSSDPDSLIRQLFLYTLSRPATDIEVATLLPMFQQQGIPAATENLQWALFNRLQFLFNY